MTTSVQIKLLHEADRNAIPLEISIDLTHHCNFRCQHCYIPDFSAPDLLTTERVCSLLDELADMGTLYLTLTGGEMLLRKDWYEIASYARNLGFSLRLYSNGSTITPDIADKIKSLHAITEVSLYSMDEEIFEKITHKGSFKKTIRGIELVREREIELLLKVPLMVGAPPSFGPGSSQPRPKSRKKPRGCRRTRTAARSSKGSSSRRC